MRCSNSHAAEYVIEIPRSTSISESLPANISARVRTCLTAIISTLHQSSTGRAWAGARTAAMSTDESNDLAVQPSARTGARTAVMSTDESNDLAVQPSAYMSPTRGGHTSRRHAAVHRGGCGIKSSSDRPRHGRLNLLTQCRAHECVLSGDELHEIRAVKVGVFLARVLRPQVPHRLTCYGIRSGSHDWDSACFMFELPSIHIVMFVYVVRTVFTESHLYLSPGMR